MTLGRWFRELIVLLVGTPRRFLYSLAGVGVAICLFDTDRFAVAVATTAASLLGAVTPLVGPAITVVIVFAALRHILRGGR
jgi:hypothetical protein